MEVAVFEGGYGIDWHRDVARRYERLHPGIRINLWGDPRVDEKLKPRILRRNPPDLVSCNLPIWKLIVAGKLHPLDPALDSPAVGREKPAEVRAMAGSRNDRPSPSMKSLSWRESLVPGILADYEYQGKTYAMPSNLGAWVCWYDRRQFRRHGWKTPETWDEFLRLCEAMKADGVAPLAFQGKYPTYAWSTLLSLYQRLVPFEKWYAMQDLAPGAFLDPDFIRAARLMREMATRFFQPGAAAMTHTESQLEWVNGRAAMVFCGLWLKNEMKEAIPEGFEMACFPVPRIKGGKGDPAAIYGGGGENFVVPADAAHPEEALDFLKYLMSLESSRSYIRRLDTLSPVKYAVRGMHISKELQSAVDVIEGSSRIFSDRLASLYPDFSRSVLQDSLASLLAGDIAPEEFAKRLEAGAEALRRDADIYKPPARGVPD